MKIKHAIVIVSIWSWMFLGFSYLAIHSKIVYDLCIVYNERMGIHPYEGPERYARRQSDFLTEVFIALTEGTTGLNTLLTLIAFVNPRSEKPTLGLMFFAYSPIVLLLVAVPRPGIIEKWSNQAL